MKFTKEEAVKELTAKYTPKVEKIEKWERTIRESVEHAWNLIGDSSEIELPKFVELTMPFLDTTAGFLRKENSDLAKDLNAKITELQKKVDSKGEGKKEGEGDGDGEKSDLLKRIEELEKINSTREAEAAIKEKKAAIKSKLKEKGVKRDEWIDLILGEASIDKDTDVEKKAASYLEMYNKMYANVEISDTPPAAGGGNTETKTDEIVKQAAEIAKNRII